MKIKDCSVKTHGLRKPILIVLPVIDCIYNLYGTELVITAGTDGKHMKGSKHYEGLAIDCRIKSIQTDFWNDIWEQLSEALGDDYDVVVERDHIHIEYDPKWMK